MPLMKPMSPPLRFYRPPRVSGRRGLIAAARRFFPFIFTRIFARVN